MVQTTFIETLWLIERLIDKLWVTEASDGEVFGDSASAFPEN